MPSPRVDRSRCLLLAWALASLGLGCDATADRGGGELEGREFLFESAEGFTPVPNTTVRVFFDEDDDGASFGFSAGCNHHSGTYEISDGRLRLSSFASTDIGCESSLAMQDAFLSDFFLSEPRVQLEGDRLTFVGASATLVFVDREVADPDRPLEGRLWTVDTFIQAGGASNLPLSKPPTVRFEESGSIAVFSGCNTGSGSFTREGGRLTLSGMAYTEAGCTDPGADHAETHVQNVLADGTVSFQIEAARLTLMRGDLGLGATTD